MNKYIFYEKNENSPYFLITHRIFINCVVLSNSLRTSSLSIWMRRGLTQLDATEKSSGIQEKGHTADLEEAH